MDQKGLSPRDLEPFIGDRDRVEQVLSRKRKLTLPMISASTRDLAFPPNP